MQAIKATPFIDYYFGLGQRISFTKKTAVVLDYNTALEKEYTLKIPFCPYIPFEIGLFSKKAVRWFLNNGFIPAEVAEKNELTFIEVQSTETSPQYKQLERALETFIKRLYKCIKTYANNKNAINDYPEWNHIFEVPHLAQILEDSRTLLEEFRNNLLNKKFDRAEICIRTAFEITYASPQFKKLYADFLLLQGNPVAVKLYRELSSKAPINEAREYLEKALIIEPDNSLLLTELEQLEYPETVSVNFALFAHSQLVKKAEEVKAAAFFDSILSKDISDPIALLVRLKTLKKGEAKKNVLEKLVTLFAKKQDEGRKEYYQKKLNTYWIPAGRNTKIQLRQPISIRKGTVSLGQSRSAIANPQLSLRKNTIDCDSPVTSLPSQSYSASSSPKGTLRKSPRQILEQSPRSKNEYLKEIDSLIKDKKFDSAKKTIITAQETIGLIGSFYKRTILVSETDDFPLLDKLLWIYVEKKSWRKTELVATRLYEEYKKDIYRQEPAHKNKKCKYGTLLAECMYEQKRTSQSVKLLYALAREEHSEKKKNNALACLNKIVEFDPSYGSFTKCEQQIIYLLKYDCKAIAKRQADDVLEAAFSQKIRNNGATKVAKYAHFGQSAAFSLDHPSYVACWMNLQYRILFTKTTAEIYTYGNPEHVTYPLEIDRAVEIPNDVALFTGKTIQWLLTTGFVPTIDKNSGICTFSFTDKDTQEKALRTLLLEKVANLINTILQPDVKKLLIAFKEYFTAENSIEAKACLKNACGNCGNKTTANALADLYADYLSLCQNTEAISKYLDLESTTKEKSIFYLEKALYAAIRTGSDKTESIYTKIQNAMGANSEERSVWTNLHAFFYHKMLSKDTEANLFYSQARSDDQKSFLLPLACLSATNTHDKDKRKELYTRVAKLCSNTPNVAKYYQQKIAFEDETTSVKTVAEYVERKCRDILEDATLQEEQRNRTRSNSLTSMPFTNKLVALEKAINEWKDITEENFYPIPLLRDCLKTCHELLTSCQYGGVLTRLQNISNVERPNKLPKSCLDRITKLLAESAEFREDFQKKLQEIIEGLPKQIKDEEFPRQLTSALNYFKRKDFKEAKQCLETACDSKFNRIGVGYNEAIEIHKKFINFYETRIRYYLESISATIPKWQLAELSSQITLHKNHVKLKQFNEAETCLIDMSILEGPEEVVLALDDLYTEYLCARSVPTIEENIRSFFSAEFLFTRCVDDVSPESIDKYITLADSSAQTKAKPPLSIESDQQRNRSQTTTGWKRAEPKTTNSPSLSKSQQKPYDNQTHRRVKPLPIPGQSSQNKSSAAGLETNIWPLCANNSLHYLEKALYLSVLFQHPSAKDIFGRIVKLLDENEAPTHIQLLTCIHAFFYLKDTWPEDAMNFYNKAVSIAPAEHPLLYFASLALCNKSNRNERVELYNKITSFFVDPHNKNTYLLKAKFLDNYTCSSSSMEEYVYQQCIKILQEERYLQAKTIVIQYLDTLIEKEFWTPAQEALKKVFCIFMNLTPCWIRYSEYFTEKYLGERFALLKREILIQSNLKNGFLDESLTRLSQMYKELSKEAKCLQLYEFIYKSCPGQSANSLYATSLLSQNKIYEAARIYYENALLCVKKDYTCLLRSTIDSIKSIDPGYQFFTPNEQFILQLMESMLDETDFTIESGIEALQIDDQPQNLDEAVTKRLSEQDTEALLDEAVTKLLNFDL